MNCRSAQSLLLAENDGVLTSAQHAELAAHVASCAACRAFRTGLAAALATLHADVQATQLPDIGAEWRAVQAKLDASRSASVPSREKRRLAPIVWISAPLAAVAAVALALFVGRPVPSGEFANASSAEFAARADYVEVADPSATPIVYSDKESGWLVVWAESADATHASG